MGQASAWATIFAFVSMIFACSSAYNTESIGELLKEKYATTRCKD
jgi:hypothetical protein